MGKISTFRQRALTLVEQGYLVGAAFPAFSVRMTRNELRCVGNLRPTSTSDDYTIEISYRIPTRPRIHVLSPPLRLAPGQNRLKHVFPGDELCLYIQGEWRPDLPLSRYVIPWVSEWLLFYEVWLATGEWLGGGHEPTIGRK